MPMIPYTGQYAQPDKDSTFSNAFSEQAYSMLESKFPQLIESIATFKVVEADLNSGKAIGTFILVLGPEVVYVPVVLGDGEIRPLIMMYHKRTDTFVPLNNEWVERVMSEATHGIGSAALQPPTLNHDVSLRSLVRPPNLAGRFAYASDQSYALRALSNSPNRVKEAFAGLLKENTPVLEHVMNVYDFAHVKDAIRKVASKTAAEALPEEVVVFTEAPSKVDATQFKRVFGDSTPSAYKHLLVDGIAVKDMRNPSKLNSLAKLDASGNFEEIKDAGVYELLFIDGRTAVCFAMPSPDSMRGDPPVGRYEAPGEAGFDRARGSRVVVVLQDGKHFSVHSCLGRRMQPEALKGSSLYGALYNETPKRPRPGDQGMFVVRKENGSWVPVDGGSTCHVSRVVTDGPATTYRAGGNYYVIDPSVPVRTPKVINSKEQRVTYLPPDVRFLPVSKEWYAADNAVVSSPALLALVLRRRMHALGAKDLKLISTGKDQLSLDGRPSMPKSHVLRDLVQDYGLPRMQVVEAVKSAEAKGSFSALVIPNSLSMKTAAFADQEGEEEDQYPEEMYADDMYGAVDPGMQGIPQGMGDPSMMGMQPQHPDLAVSYGDDVTIDPSMMQAVSQAQLQDPTVLDAAVMVSLAQLPEMRELIQGYLPNLKQAMDNFARVLLALWIHQDKVREQLGDSTYSSLEDLLVSTFKSVGSAIMGLSDGTDVFEATKD